MFPQARPKSGFGEGERCLEEQSQEGHNSGQLVNVGILGWFDGVWRPLASLLIGPASGLYPLKLLAKHLTHLVFVPLGGPWELDWLKELYCGEDRLDRGCRVLLEQKACLGDGSRSR